MYVTYVCNLVNVRNVCNVCMHATKCNCTNKQVGRYTIKSNRTYINLRIYNNTWWNYIMFLNIFLPG